MEEGEVAVEVDAIVLPDTYTAPAGMFKPYLQAMKALLHPARKLRQVCGERRSWLQPANGCLATLTGPALATLTAPVLTTHAAPVLPPPVI